VATIDTWVIPLVLVGIPAFLIAWFVLAQAGAVSLWLPVVRRTIGPSSWPLPFRHRRG
jgi:hypothetical protein